jgi:hypothetical protein
MSEYGDFCKEQRSYKNKAKQKMVDCPWSNYTHKTWPNEICMRCNMKVDKDGNRDFG